MKLRNAVFIGCAGWSLPRAEQHRFPGSGTHLARYAARLPATEINSSFHRSHRPSTYARWVAAVPDDFRFSMKVPKEITHKLRLQTGKETIRAFLTEANHLKEKLGCFLVQLPPSLAFDAAVAGQFFETLRDLTRLPVACEPRHPTWFESEADTLLVQNEIARVAADPARVPAASLPGGGRAISYYRLHGSPKMYYSTYSEDYIIALATRLKADVAGGRPVWCIFDNTTLGAAAGNALDLFRLTDPFFQRRYCISSK